MRGVKKTLEDAVKELTDIINILNSRNEKDDNIISSLDDVIRDIIDIQDDINSRI